MGEEEVVVGGWEGGEAVGGGEVVELLVGGVSGWCFWGGGRGTLIVV